ncbi:transposase [[Limnothrix rosea] IAM M-220]|uniref:transposase n=1 Tax=[Limnothrix rosea] IAM M-220 TaxID=454133 RepID=UPI0009636A11|nr:transposase [[Limnothrix rosea] IAM M-220]OKH18625.1 transposase [[Limnothrix rosea] IAM M-220]
MAKSADIGSKRLISLNPDAWVRWIIGAPDLRSGEFLDPQFQWVSRDSDVLLRVTCPNDGDFLLLNELQLRHDSQMPQRIAAYAALAREKFDLPVYPVLINILQPSRNPQIPHCYQSVFKGLQARQDYHVINLWEVDTATVFSQDIASLLPFVPILKNGNAEQPIREAVRRLRQDRDLQELEPLLAFFASFVLEIPLVQQIMRWDMSVLQESPWYEDILKRGQIMGLKEGIEQGIEQEKREVIQRLAQKDFTVQAIAEIMAISEADVLQYLNQDVEESSSN